MGSAYAIRKSAFKHVHRKNTTIDSFISRINQQSTTYEGCYEQNSRSAEQVNLIHKVRLLLIKAVERLSCRQTADQQTYARRAVPKGTTVRTRQPEDLE